MFSKFRWVIFSVSAVAFGGCMSKQPDMSTTKMTTSGTMFHHPDIVDTATGPGMEQVSTVVQAIKAAGLVDALKGPGPFTVFAPTNAAFAQLPAGTVDDLLKPENKDKLKQILLYHIHKGDAFHVAEMKSMDLSTMEGTQLKVTINGDTAMIGSAKIVKPDIECSNGVIDWIDTVLMP